MRRFTQNVATLIAALMLSAATSVLAQSTTSGDISGTLTDPTGALVANATVTVTNVSTGESKTTTSTAAGAYRVSLLSPGPYKVTVKAAGFETSVGTATVAAGAVTNDNLKLALGQQGVTVEVTSEAELVNTTNGDVSTVFSAEAVQSLPNPGNDLTFVAQTAPGSVMNTGTTAGGYGNFSSFGISGLSNMFTLDGGYENDPFLNLNNTGASNLTLGNNEVDTVSVVSPAYSSQFGGLGGAQVNEITASGGNHIHGNLNYYWDGRAMNSNDWFNKQNQAFYGLQNIPTFVNANQWGAAIGGPIVHDKLFFFINTEGIRATTPNQSQVGAPNTAFQNCALGKDPGGTVTIPGYGAASGTGSNTVTYASCASLNAAADTGYINGSNSAGVGNLGDGIPFQAAPANQQQLLSTIFGVYNNSPYRHANAVTQSTTDPTAVTYLAAPASTLTEWLLTARVDWNISDKDHFYIHYKQDHGTQPTDVDVIDPRFSALSLQPAWEGQINETHTFTPNLVNQLVLTGNYYSAPFENTNNYLPVAPYTLEYLTGDFTTYGGADFDFPQGRNVSGYQVIDDVSYTKGRNTLRFGYNIRRDNITDIQGVETVSPAAVTAVEDFGAGNIDYEFIERYPQRPTQPVSVYDMGAYVEDAFKITPKLTVTAGLRVERNSNPVCHTNCFQVLSTSPFNLTTGTASRAVPYNAAVAGGFITANRHRAFTGFQKFAPMPRMSFNYQASEKTVIRGGFGMFSDSFPGVIADALLSNAPDNFHALAYGYASGQTSSAYSLTPGTTYTGYVPGLGANVTNNPYGGTVTTASAAAFQNGFQNGGTYTSIASAVAGVGGAYSVPSFTTPARNISYPTYEEFSLAVEQRIDNKTNLSATYVGNHGYHEPVEDATRNLTYAKASANNFAQLPTSRPVTPFNTLTYVYSGASSNYNGVVVSAVRHSKSLTLQFNYEFSKALDEVSNGGFEPFAPDAGDTGSLTAPGNLHANYGPADYNVKHNTTGAFVYQVPSPFKSGLKKNLFGSFEFSGDVFHQSGLPFSITQSTSSASAAPAAGGGTVALPGTFSSGGVNLLARQLTNNFDHHCGGGAHAQLPDLSNPNPCGFTSAFATPTNFGQQGRNSLVAPSYTNVNFGAFKTFGIGVPYLEGAKIKLGAQFFNLFNHPNFQNPNHSRSANNADLGAIAATVGAPTSILGSVGGADASPRLIQLHAALTF